MIRLAASQGVCVPLADTLDAMLRNAHRENLALRMFLGCCEGWLQSRGAISDTALVDMIAIAASNAASALADAMERGE